MWGVLSLVLLYCKLRKKRWSDLPFPKQLQCHGWGWSLSTFPAALLQTSQCLVKPPTRMFVCKEATRQIKGKQAVQVWDCLFSAPLGASPVLSQWEAGVTTGGLSLWPPPLSLLYVNNENGRDSISPHSLALLSFCLLNNWLDFLQWEGAGFEELEI